MNTEFAIILHGGKEYLCHKDGECFVDVSCPMRAFTAGEDDFEIVKCSRPFSGRTFPYHDRHLSIVPEIYHNGWLALCLKDPKTDELYTVLTVNLENDPAFALPDRAFIDINNNPAGTLQAQSACLWQDVECPVSLRNNEPSINNQNMKL